MYILPIHGVKAIGLNKEGSSGSLDAAGLAKRRMTPVFQSCGTEAESQQQLNRSSSAGSREGHILNTR